MPINQSRPRFPAAVSETFSVGSGLACSWVHVKPGPAQISLSVCIDVIILHPISIWKKHVLSLDFPCAFHLTLSTIFLLYVVLQIGLMEGFLQNCVVDSGGRWTAAALGPGSHRWRFSPRNPVCCQPRPRFADTVCQFAALCWLQPLVAGPENRGRTGLICESRLNSINFKIRTKKLLLLQISNWSSINNCCNLQHANCIWNDAFFVIWNWSFLYRCYGLWLFIVPLTSKNSQQVTWIIINHTGVIDDNWYPTQSSH